MKRLVLLAVEGDRFAAGPGQNAFHRPGVAVESLDRGGRDGDQKLVAVADVAVGLDQRDQVLVENAGVSHLSILTMRRSSYWSR